MNQEELHPRPGDDPSQDGESVWRPFDHVDEHLYFFCLFFHGTV